MPFERPITIEEALKNIENKKYLLPAIQREFVWTTEQIECFFDSLMRDYPVGTFLLWHVEKERSQDYQFYNFIKNYHEYDQTHNPKADVNTNEDLTAVLDGQQRLTAVYLGLTGTYAYKIKGKRWDNTLAYPKRKLYLNILSPASDTNLEYDFRFLTDEEASERTPKIHWFKVGDVLGFQKEVDVANYPIRNNIAKWGPEKAEFATSTLFKLYTVLRKDPVIHYFLEKDEQIDKVLNIFIRVNSGGTPLSYSDLLLSIATAQWEKRDAREEITRFVDEINSIGNGFDFNKDFVLKSCLVLADFTETAFKVENFNKSNMMKIEHEWDNISEAIRLSVMLISQFGYNRDLLTSAYAVIPIAYYFMKKGNPHELITSSKFDDDRGRIRNWLIRSLLKKAFGGSPDGVLGPARQIIKANYNTFPLDMIIEHFRGKPKSIIINDDDIENLFLNKYGRPLTFSILALLYPTLDFKNKFHMDHIHPRSLFNHRKLVAKRFDRYLCDFCLENHDLVPNIQLLEGDPNIKKSDTEFEEWINKKYPDGSERRDYMRKNYIPDVDLSLRNFEEFINQRKRLMADGIKKILND